MSKEFINKVAPYAVKDMQDNNVLASLTIAQAILESNWGKSALAVQGNNLFGIKGSYQGQTITFPTREYIGGKWVTTVAEFRAYPSWLESIHDHSALFHRGTSDRRDRYYRVIGEKDYKKACREVWAAGYATDPNYPSKLINLIETYKLDQYDHIDPVPNWKDGIMARAKAAGLISDDHKPDDPAPKWFVLETIMRSMKGD